MFYRTSVSGPNGCFIITSRSFQPLTYWDFVKQVAIDVERDEDEGGTVGETFTDYVNTLSIDLDAEYTLAELLSVLIDMFCPTDCEFCYVCTYFQRPPKLSLGLSHPDPVVETSSLSAVQPPEPTYCLNIMDELDETKALSCLQIETIVYACQVGYHPMIIL
jgi:hypothetical protein